LCCSYFTHSSFNDFCISPGLVGAPACGDVMKMQFEADENGVIIDAKFKTFGCGSAIGIYYDSVSFSLCIYLIVVMFV
jgi:NifU-like protein involved in Fe-S cluster formation